MSVISSRAALRNVDKIELRILTLYALSSRMTQPDFYFIGIILKAIWKMIGGMQSRGNIRRDEVQS